MDYEKAISKYIELRHEIESIEREAKLKTGDLRKNMALLEAWITSKADAEGLKTVPSFAGTGYWSTHYTCTVPAPAQFFDFVRDNQQWDLLEKRASKTAVKAFAEATGTPPPGVNFSSYRAFNVRENKGD